MRQVQRVLAKPSAHGHFCPPRMWKQKGAIQHHDADDSEGSFNHQRKIELDSIK